MESNSRTNHLGANVSRSNTDLLNEIDELLENSTAETLDIDKILSNLDLLEERAPVEEIKPQEEAWKEFEAAYLPASTENTDKRILKRRHPARKALRYIGIAAALVAVFCVTASAFGYNPLSPVIRFVGDVVQIIGNPSGELDLPTEAEETYRSMREALDQNGAEDALCPTWIPKRFAISSVSVKSDDVSLRISAIYYSEYDDLVVIVDRFDYNNYASLLEKDAEGNVTILVINGTEYKVSHNIEYLQAWNYTEDYVYTIMGQISEEELEAMIKSMK